MSAYYNEIDPYAAAWLRNLISAGHIAPGVVDERSIVDVQPDDLIGYTQVHFFAGIGGWSLAARIAGWPDDKPLWTGSCPCQPFSAAGKRKGTADERHLWPEMRRLIAACRPDVVAGEQVASADGRQWLAGVRADLEDLAYASWAADLCAASAGAPHIRQRLWWLADAIRHDGRGQHGRCVDRAASTDERTAGQQQRLWLDAGHGGATGRLADTDGGLAGDGRVQRGGQHGQQPQDGGAGGLADDNGRRQPRLEDGRLQRQPVHDADGRREPCGLGDTNDTRSQGRLDGSGGGGRADQRPLGPAGQPGFWSTYDVVHCTDGKARRFESFAQPLVDGLPRSLGPVRTDIAEAFAEEVNRYASFMCVDPGAAMRDLWVSLVEKAVQRPVGGSPDLHAPQVLLSFLRQLADQGWPLAQSLPRTGPEAQETIVRCVFGHEAASRPSHRRGLAEQRSGQSANSVHPLSSVLARCAQAAWGEAHAANAAAVFPLAWNATNRVGRLRAYGNAIVPWVAAEVLGAYLDGRGLRVTPVSDIAPDAGVFA